MPKNAQQSRLLIGSLHYSLTATSVGVADEVDMYNVSTLISTAQEFIPGRSTSTAPVELVVDTSSTAGLQFSNLTSWKATQPSPMTYAPSGLTSGSEAILTSAIQSGFTIDSSASDAVRGSIETQTDGATDVGLIVEDLTAITTDTTGTARDQTAGTTNGGVAHLHVTAFSLATSDVITIEHSVDGSTSWATLVTFATVTGLTSQRVEVAAATTVRRYLRVVDDCTGAGSITRSVAFARR